jgi:hypothetical protein
MARLKSAATRLDEALAAHEAAKHRLAGLHVARNKALLADDDVAALKLAAEIDLQERAARGASDKVELLKAEAEREAAERRAKERARLIERIELRLAERDKIGVELQETLAKADKLFQALFRIAGECRSAWPWKIHDLPAILLGDQSILHAVEHQLFKCGARPALGGGMDRPRPPSFPGGRCPRLELTLQPDRIPSLGDVLRAGTRMASEVMRTGRASGAIPISAVPIPPAVLREAPERTEAERKLAALLKEQHDLSEDVSPAGEEKYAACVSQIAQVQAEIDAFRALGEAR